LVLATALGVRSAGTSTAHTRVKKRQIVEKSGCRSLTGDVVRQYDDGGVGGGVPAEDSRLLCCQQRIAQRDAGPPPDRTPADPLDRDCVQRVIHEHRRRALGQEVQLLGDTDEGVGASVNLCGGDVE
jgi:hypothetical protein